MEQETNGTERKVIRTSQGLRDALFDELERLVNGKSDAKTANSIARLAGEVVNTVRLELEVQEFKSRVPKPESINRIAEEIPTLTLGKGQNA
jgi:hypothetical protein